MKKSIFEISKMDCPCEESLIRTKLQGMDFIKNLEFDLANRKLTIIHSDGTEIIEKSIIELNLGGKRVSTQDIDEAEIAQNTKPTSKDQENNQQKKLLLAVLGINFAFFVIEMTTGLISNSMGLIADSLDMLADSLVYAISLIAVGASLIRKKRIAISAGYLQIGLALIGFVEVLRRFFGAELMPDFKVMLIVSIFALIANGICIYILQKSNGKEEAHIKASMIFTSNDVIINLGVIVAGILVNTLNSNKPDLIVGTIVFILVMQGAFRILKLGK